MSFFFLVLSSSSYLHQMRPTLSKYLYSHPPPFVCVPLMNNLVTGLVVIYLVFVFFDCNLSFSHSVIKPLLILSSSPMFFPLLKLFICVSHIDRSQLTQSNFLKTFSKTHVKRLSNSGLPFLILNFGLALSAYMRKLN